MPTYICAPPADAFGDARKAAIAEAITRIHSEETGAPTFFVQVVIEEKMPTDRFLGGTRMSDTIWVRGDIRSGRTEAQREKNMLRIREEIARITGVKKDYIWVYLCNLAATDMVEYGHVLPTPGEEQAWYEKLPAAMTSVMRRCHPRQDRAPQ